MKIIGLAGWSGAGKTTLTVGLIPELTRRGYRVSTIKHAHHDFDIDQPGKDSYRHREAGAHEVLVSSANRWAMVHELRGASEPALDDLLAKLEPVDLLLIEGFKRDAHDKIEVHRPSLGKPLLCTEDAKIVAIACDGSPARLDPARPDLAHLDLNDIPAIADFVIAHCALGKPGPGAG